MRMLLSTICFLSLLLPGYAADSEQKAPFKLHHQVYKSETLSENPALLVVLHGDAPFNRPDIQYYFADRLARTTQDVVAVGILRPGYVDTKENRSAGVRGKTNSDNWHAENTDSIAALIRELVKEWKPRKTIAVGHSGGAALTANILGRHPGLIDGAVLVSFPSDAAAWRKHMLDVTGFPVFTEAPKTLSAIELIDTVPKTTEIKMLVGDQDNTTPPWLSERYLEKGKKLGLKITMETLPGKGHEVLFDPVVLFETEMLLGE